MQQLQWLLKETKQRRLILTQHLPDVDLDREDNNMSDEEWLKQAAPLLNASIFGATLLARSDASPSMVFHVSDALAIAIEESEVQADWRDAKMYIPPAASWMIIAGDKLYRYSNGQRDPKAPLASSHSLWNGENKFSLERWSFWKRRFLELAEVASFDDETQGFAAKAAARMTEIEA